MTDKKAELSKRLRAAADYVREGARLADIGTDHAYLPVFLTLDGRVSASLASDIAIGPIKRAREHIAQYHLEGKIETALAPGLDAAGSFCPTDIVIAGMGGELIVSILDAAPFVKDKNIRLILQPMTKEEVLRGYLAQNGFEISDETLVYEDRRYYKVLSASYTGKPYTLSLTEKHFGRIIFKKGGENLHGLLLQKKKQYEKILEGKKAGNEKDDETEALLAFVNERIGRI